MQSLQVEHDVRLGLVAAITTAVKINKMTTMTIMITITTTMMMITTTRTMMITITTITVTKVMSTMPENNYINLRHEEEQKKED